METDEQRNTRWTFGVKHTNHPNWTIFPITGVVLGAKGTPIGSKTKSGYIVSQHVAFHRLIYEAAYNITLLKSDNSKLTEIINHINFEKDDNRIINLEILNNQQNTQHRKPILDDLKGSHFNTEKGKWKSEMRCDGKAIFLGYFDTEKDCSKAYNDYALYVNEKYNFKYNLNDIEGYIATPRNVPEENLKRNKESYTSKLIGVQLPAGRTSYLATIKLNNENFYLGSSKIELECAKMYNQQALFYNNNKDVKMKYELNIIQDYITIEKDIYSEIQKNKIVNKKSDYFGVTAYKNTTLWSSYYVKDKKQIVIGRYEDEKEAALEYNKVVLEINKTSKHQYKINQF